MEVFLKILVIAVLFVINIFIVKSMIKKLIKDKVEIVEVKLTDEEFKKMNKELEYLLNKQNKEDK